MSTKARTAAGNLRDSGIPLQEAHGMSTMLISLTFQSACQATMQALGEIHKSAEELRLRPAHSCIVEAVALLSLLCGSPQVVSWLI